MGIIYLVRHGERPSSEYQYHVSLTPHGHRQAHDLITKLPQSAIIFSSPFVRCLETIDPYASAHHLLINIEGGLAEASDPGSLPERYYHRQALSYRPSFSYDYRGRRGRYSFDTLKDRIGTILEMITTTYPSDAIIVMCTHNPVINAFLSLAGHPVRYSTPHPVGDIIGPLRW